MIFSSEVAVRDRRDESAAAAPAEECFRWGRHPTLLPCCSAEAELTRRQIVDPDIRTGGVFSLTRQGPATAPGASNYSLDVYPALPPAGGEKSDTNSQAAARV